MRPCVPAVPSPLGRRCPAGADEGTGEASCARTPRVASRRTLTPTPLPEGEGLAAAPSPLGRRCPAGADEGTSEASCTQTQRVAFAPYPHPNPSPGGRGASSCSLLPSGEGAPQGRRRVRAQPRAPTPRVASRRTLTPTPLPMGEGLAPFPSPTGRRCPEGADEGTGAASYPNSASRFAPHPHPNPSPGGRGASGCSLLPSGEGARRADEGTGEASCTQTPRVASRHRNAELMRRAGSIRRQRRGRRGRRGTRPRQNAGHGVRITLRQSCSFLSKIA